MEKKLNLLWVKELEIVLRKYKKKTENSNRKSTEMKTQYKTIEEVQEAYGYGEINQTEYESLCGFFEGRGKDQSLEDLFLKNLKKELAVYRSALKDIDDLLKVEVEK